MIFPQNSVYAAPFNDMLLRFAAAGLDKKVNNDLAWDLQRGDSQLLDSGTSKSFSMDDVVERKLNLADTEGMFLLMAVGYILAGSVLFSEIVGGCAKSCRAFIRRNSGVDEKTGRIFSAAQMEPKTFSDKLKSKIRRSLRSKPKPLEVEDPILDDGVLKDSNEQVEPNDVIKKEIDIGNGELNLPQLKGTTSFCTLKRIMLMRKKRKDEKKAKKAAIEAKTDNENNFENYIDFMSDSGGAEHVMIENEKRGETGDLNSLIGSPSVYSDAQIITEETAAEVNELSVSDRENNPSKEFGEIV